MTGYIEPKQHALWSLSLGSQKKTDKIFTDQSTELGTANTQRHDGSHAFKENMWLQRPNTQRPISL